MHYYFMEQTLSFALAVDELELYQDSYLLPKWMT